MRKLPTIPADWIQRSGEDQADWANPLAQNPATAHGAMRRYKTLLLDRSGKPAIEYDIYQSGKQYTAVGGDLGELFWENMEIRYDFKAAAAGKDPWSCSVNCGPLQRNTDGTSRRFTLAEAELILRSWGLDRRTASAATEASPATQPTARVVSVGDIRVVAWRDNENVKSKDKPHRTAMVAYLYNCSEGARSVCYADFVGPILGSNGPIEGVPLEMRLPPGNRNAVILAPGEAIGRTFIVDEPSDQVSVTAYYTIYAPGHEGKQDHIAAIVYPDGKVQTRNNR